ncbi:uncharacterized protein PAC_01796 [Phialocephala subalpina]|uniref:Uncharacterized protein n=1 Tax=Phialocephala subalpina TaxID=576137 RepID=A0A1L7WGL8_9HELO|nr:uncharacterized protein PAC_01796 [Phialocephala subalpina]
MTGRQRTFELIPTTLVKPTASKPPMTSKAAKKAYLQAQRGPKISKAEQRKRDAAEYERIRKKHEKEKNAAKAKAVREKKAAKLEAEKEARRKAGVPEPSRFVRGSQPTISKFVRSNGLTKRSWNQMEDLVEDTDDTASDAGVQVKDEEEPPPAKRVALDQDSEDEFGDFPSFSQSVLEELDSSVLVPSAPASPTKKQYCQSGTHSPIASPQLPPRKVTNDEFPFDEIDDMVTAQLHSEVSGPAAKSDNLEPPAISLPPPVLQPPKQANNELFGTPVPASRFGNKAGDMGNGWKKKHDVSTSIPKRALQERSVNMAPPKLPFKKASISFATPLARPGVPRLLNDRFSSGPPSATQAFLEDHLDDFLLSPSQQVRELLEDVDDIPSSTQIARELSPKEPTVQKLAEKIQMQSDNFFDGLICTQDFVLSPQDLEEIATPSRAQLMVTKESKPRIPNPLPARSAPQTRPTSRDRPRFFEEKEDDLLHAALHESKDTKARGRPKQPSKVTPAPHVEPASKGQMKARVPRFFEEKEEDILQAALHESKKLVAKQVKPKSKPVPAKGRRPLLAYEESSKTDYGDFNFDQFFEGEEEKMIQAAIEESKKAAGLDTQKVPLKDAEAPQKQKRKLKRVASAATDYGDDEFSECELELLALC